jgi:hypothetical protein
MTKNVLIALLLIALIKPAASLVYLCFTALGVTIGILLK